MTSGRNSEQKVTVYKYNTAAQHILIWKLQTNMAKSGQIQVFKNGIPCSILHKYVS